MHRIAAVLVVVALAASLACGSVVPGGVPSSTVPTQTTSSGAETDSSFEAYYYIVDDSSQQTAEYRVFRVSPNLTEPDVLVHSFAIPGSGHRVITDSWKQSTILFVANGETQSVIYALDVSSEGSEPRELMTVPIESSNGEAVGDARLIEDGNALAFLTAEGLRARAENSVLHVVALEDREEKESYPLAAESPLYSGFRFLAATPDSTTIYLEEIGGDGPMVWSQWYRVDRRSQVVQLLDDLPPMAKDGFGPVTYAFSPDRSKFAYADFSAVVERTDLQSGSEEEGGGPAACLRFNSDAINKYEAEGGTISIRDLGTGRTDEVFRNLAYSNNYCKNVARRIVSLQWLDDSLLAFETIDGVYALEIDTRQQETIFTFEDTTSPGQVRRPAVVSIQLPFIFFSDHSLVRTDTAKRLEFDSPEAQQGSFFTFD
jgi:hypothetical protein